MDQEAWLRGVESALRAHLADRPALILFGERDPVKLMGFPRRYQRILPRHLVRHVPGEAHFPTRVRRTS